MKPISHPFESYGVNDRQYPISQRSKIVIILLIRAQNSAWVMQKHCRKKVVKKSTISFERDLVLAVQMGNMSNRKGEGNEKIERGEKDGEPSPSSPPFR